MLAHVFNQMCQQKEFYTFLSIMVNSWHFKKIYYLAVAMTLIGSSQMCKG